jgi:hypothetical protein
VSKFRTMAPRLEIGRTMSPAVSRKGLQSCKLSTGTGQFLSTCGRNPKLFRDIDVAKSVQLATLTKVLDVLTRIAELPGGTAVMILLEILEVSLGQL